MNLSTSSLKYAWFGLIGLGLVLAQACTSVPPYYQRSLSTSDSLQLAKDLEGGMVQRYYQGSPEEQITIAKALSYDPLNADLHREQGIAWAKRGLKSQWQGYDRAIQLDPLNWQGYRGYMHLYFHRDYRRAIADFDACDALTPDVTDYPQANSVHYMRGVAYMQLGSYDTAFQYFERWLEEETAEVEARYLGPQIWKFRAVCLDAFGSANEAEASIRKGLQICGGESAELNYYLAKRLLKQEKQDSATYYLQQALLAANQGYTFSRPYVEEFYEVTDRELREALEEM